MAKKMKKTIPWLTILTVLIVFVVVAVLNLKAPKIEAGLIPTTGVTVGQVVPDNLTGTTDGSTVGSPTEATDAVTFTATGTDDNGDQWKLLVCDSTGTSGVACDDGTTWCVSPGFVNSGSPNTCDYTTEDADDYSNDWFAYACDATGCSATADTAASPFIVNHAPEFPAVSDDGNKDPGATQTISTSVDCKDDVKDTNGQVKLYVCKTSGATSSGCTGDEWCNSGAFVDNNPSCGFTVPDPDGTYNYHTYVYDTWGMASDGVKQGYNGTFDVNNKAPTVSSVSLNSGTSFSITVNSSSDISATATISDENGCTIIGNGGDEIASAKAVFFQDDLETSGCTTDENDCYIIASCSLGSCSGGSLTATCTATMWYNANPTDNGAYATNQTWNADKWTAWVEGKDDDLATGNNTNSGETVDVNTTEGLDITETSIDYPELDPGQSTTTANNDSVITNSVGNCPIDNNIHGSTVLTSGGNTIPNSNQKYDLSDDDWGDMSDTLQDTATLFELAQTTKTTDHNSPIQETIYFGLKIPDVQAAGTYAGVNTFAAVEETTF